MSLLEHPDAVALLDDAEVSAADVRGCRRRLERFLQRNLPRFYRKEQHELALGGAPRRVAAVSEGRTSTYSKTRVIAFCG